MKPRKQKCETCDGSGSVWEDIDYGDDGWIKKLQDTLKRIEFDGEPEPIIECPDCKGEGIEYIISSDEYEEYVELLKLQMEFVKVVHNEIRGNYNHPSKL